MSYKEPDNTHHRITKLEERLQQTEERLTAKLDTVISLILKRTQDPVNTNIQPDASENTQQQPEKHTVSEEKATVQATKQLEHMQMSQATEKALECSSTDGAKQEETEFHRGKRPILKQSKSDGAFQEVCVGQQLHRQDHGKKYTSKEQHGSQKGFTYQARLSHRNLRRTVSESRIDNEFSDAEKENKKWQILLRQKPSKSFSEGIETPDVSEDDEGVVMNTKPATQSPIAVEELLRNRLSHEESNQLNEYYSQFLMETQTGLPSCIVTTTKGRFTKKIFVTYQEERHKAEEFTKKRFPKFWADELFLFQEAKKESLKFAGEVGIITSTDKCDYTFGTESCVARDDTGEFVLTVRHIVNKVCGPTKTCQNYCFNFDTNFNPCSYDQYLGYYGSLFMNNRYQVIDVSVFKVQQSTLPSNIPELSVSPVHDNLIHVEKSGIRTGDTRGLILDFNVSENINGNNCVGMFVVVAVGDDGQIHPERKFADRGDSGAVVRVRQDGTEGAGIGLVYKVMDDYEFEGKTWKHVTLCIHLDAQLHAIQRLWNKHLHLYSRQNKSVVFSVVKRQRINSW